MIMAGLFSGAVALLQLLHRYKEKEENAYPGVILVMDEAEQLFPIKCSGSEKAHVDRIITKTKEIADNGRKRHFGQFICTHLAESIDSRVVGLAETIMAFRCSGDDKWIRSNCNKATATSLLLGISNPLTLITLIFPGWQSMLVVILVLFA